jgi:hypothetical protein
MGFSIGNEWAVVTLGYAVGTVVTAERKIGTKKTPSLLRELFRRIWHQKH